MVVLLHQLFRKLARNLYRVSANDVLALAIAFTLMAPALTLTSDEAVHHQSHVQLGFVAPATDTHSEAGHRTCLECPDHAWTVGERLSDHGLIVPSASSDLDFLFAENIGRSIDHGPLQRPPRA